jgi:hypothetical protein
VFPDHQFRLVVRPNCDTLYSSAWIDLSNEPIVLSVPGMGDRYYVMPFMDAWTNVFAYVGTRTTGNDPGHYMVFGPNWKGNLPDGVEKIQSPTNMTWLIGTYTGQRLERSFQRTSSSGPDYLDALEPMEKWRQPNPGFTRSSDPSGIEIRKIPWPWLQRWIHQHFLLRFGPADGRATADRRRRTNAKNTD